MAGVGRNPHFLETVNDVRGELADPEMEQIFRAERGIEAHVRVLELHRDRAVGVLAERHLAEVRHVIAEGSGPEDIHFLGELEIVLDRGDGPIVVERRRVDVGQLDVDGQRHGARNFARPDRLRPELLVGRRTETDGRLLDHVLCFTRQAVAAEPEGLAKRIELRKDDVTGLTARLVLCVQRPGLRRHSSREQSEKPPPRQESTARSHDAS